MPEYRRFTHAGGTWFFTVNLAQRRGNTLLVDRVSELRAAFDTVKCSHSLEIVAAVILPEHLHCIWTLPVGIIYWTNSLNYQHFLHVISSLCEKPPSHEKHRLFDLWVTTS